MDIKTDINIKESENNFKQTAVEIDGLRADIELHANKFLLLLQNSTMPADVKEALVEMLPAFSLDQIERFIGILEAKYLDEKTQDIDQKFKTEMSNVVENFSAEDKKDGEAFLKQINIISQNI